MEVSKGGAAQAANLCAYLDSLTGSLVQVDTLNLWKQVSEDEQMKIACALMSTYHDVSTT